jgi:hypothetical protein
VIGGRRPVDDTCTEARDCVDDELGPGTGDRIGCERHPGCGRIDHPLDHNSHGHRLVYMPGLSISDGPRRIHRLPAGANRSDQLTFVAYIENRLVLPGKARTRQILRRRARPNSDRSSAVLSIRLKNRRTRHLATPKRVRGDTEPVRYVLASLDQSS